MNSRFLDNETSLGAINLMIACLQCKRLNSSCGHSCSHTEMIWSCITFQLTWSNEINWAFFFCPCNTQYPSVYHYFGEKTCALTQDSTLLSNNNNFLLITKNNIFNFLPYTKTAATAPMSAVIIISKWTHMNFAWPTMNLFHFFSSVK